MKRVIVYCEGPTEETFVKRLLSPLFYSKEIFLMPSSCNGVSKYSIIKRDLSNICKNDPNAIITTMLDYYGLPSETPGLEKVYKGDIYNQVNCVEESIKQDINVRNLIPNLTLHEFEALLFSKPECFSCCGIDSGLVEKLCKIRDEAETPEHINNNPNTAPSKRILSIYPEYNKIIDGYHVADDIGINVMRKECRHFDGWISRLLELNEM